MALFSGQSLEQHMHDRAKWAAVAVLVEALVDLKTALEDEGRDGLKELYDGLDAIHVLLRRGR